MYQKDQVVEICRKGTIVKIRPTKVGTYYLVRFGNNKEYWHREQELRVPQTKEKKSLKQIIKSLFK